MLDKNYFIGCMKMLCSAYDKDFSEQQIEAYYMVLNEYSEKQFMYMVKKVIEEDTFFPRPANLIEKLKQLEVSVESEADKFVGQTLDFMKRYSTDDLLKIYGNGFFRFIPQQKFKDPIAYEVVKRNLERLRVHNSDDNMALYAQLKKAYISEHNMQKTIKVKEENPQLVFNDKIKELSETLKIG